MDPSTASTTTQGRAPRKALPNKVHRRRRIFSKAPKSKAAHKVVTTKVVEIPPEPTKPVPKRPSRLDRLNSLPPLTPQHPKAVELSKVEGTVDTRVLTRVGEKRKRSSSGGDDDDDAEHEEEVKRLKELVLSTKTIHPRKLDMPVSTPLTTPPTSPPWVPCYSPDPENNNKETKYTYERQYPIDCLVDPVNWRNKPTSPEKKPMFTEEEWAAS